MGAIGGSLWHGVKGFRNSPHGERRIGALTAIKARAPVLGGNFGVWGGLFSSFDCAVKGVRRKEDPYNAIIAGFFTGGALAVRGGVRAARNSAIGCACLLAVIEGVGIGIQRMMAEGTRLDVGAAAAAFLSLFLEHPFYPWDVLSWDYGGTRSLPFKLSMNKEANISSSSRSPPQHPLPNQQLPKDRWLLENNPSGFSRMSSSLKYSTPTLVFPPPSFNLHSSTTRSGPFQLSS